MEVEGARSDREVRGYEIKETPLAATSEVKPDFRRIYGVHAMHRCMVGRAFTFFTQDSNERLRVIESSDEARPNEFSIVR